MYSCETDVQGHESTEFLGSNAMGWGKGLSNLDLEVQVAYRNIKVVFVSLSLLSIYLSFLVDHTQILIPCCCQSMV